MEKLMQRKNVLLEYASSGQGFSENSPKTPQRGSDEMDFNDVFGGPPRRFSMQEVGVRYSFGDLEEERASSPWKEKPVFGEERVGRRRNQIDDFYDDIFRGNDSYNSPRRSDRDQDNPFGSNPGSRIMSPSRPLPSKAEPFGTSLPAQFSLPAKLTKAMELPTFAPRNQYKIEGSNNSGLNTPHSPNTPSRFSNIQTFQIQDDVRNEVNSVYRQSPLSREVSYDDLLSTVGSKDENSRNDVKKADENADNFHFSIYKWAGKGVPMLMPLAFENNLRSKALKRDEKSEKNSEKKPSIRIDEGNMEIESLKEVSEKNEERRKEETKALPKSIEEALFDNFDSKSQRNENDNVAFGGSRQKLKADEVNKREKIEKEVPLEKINEPPKSKGKTLRVLIADAVEKSGNVIETKESKRRTSKGTHSLKQAGKNLKKNGGISGIDTIVVDKSSLQEADATSEVIPDKSGIKGKVKEFVQIFNVEADSNPKADFRKGNKSFRWNAVSINQKENEVLLNYVDKKPDISLKVDESTNKNKAEQHSHTIPSYKIDSSSINQKNEFSSESVDMDSNIPVENPDDFFEDNFQVEELLSDDHEKVAEKEEDSDDMKAIDAKIRQWSVGKKGNIRSLLSTLQFVLWAGSGWTPVPLMDLIEANAVKRAYQKALLRLHPDKLQQKGAAASQKYTAEKIFDILQFSMKQKLKVLPRSCCKYFRGAEAWDHFNTLTPL